MATQLSYILRYSTDESAWEEYPLSEADHLIGRTSDCDLQLKSNEVSRYHARLRLEAGAMWLTDLGSTNGTLLDGVALTPNLPVALLEGQRIEIGPFALVVSAMEQLVEFDAAATIVRPAAEEPLPTFDVEALREEEFPQIARRVYLDNARNAPLPRRARDRMQWSADELLVRPSQHMGAGTLQMFSEFQSTLAAFVNAASPGEIVVVPSCSIGINAIAQSLPLEPGDNIIFCDTEFPANAYPWMSLERDSIVIRLAPSINGGLTLEALEKMADERTRVVATSSVQFFSGYRADLAGIGAFSRERNILFVVDAMQSIGHIPIDVQQMQIDVLVTGGHKSLLSPPGVGFMYVRDIVSQVLRPRLVSALSTRNWLHFLNYDMTPGEGAMRFLLGTPNVPGMYGLLESVALINELTREAIDRHTTGLAARAIARAQALGYPVVTPAGAHGPIVTFQSGLDVEQTEALLRSLEEEHDVLIGSHLDKLGVPHLRLSLHCFNTEEDIERLFEALEAGRQPPAAPQ